MSKLYEVEIHQIKHFRFELCANENLSNEQISESLEDFNWHEHIIHFENWQKFNETVTYEGFHVKDVLLKDDQRVGNFGLVVISDSKEGLTCERFDQVKHRMMQID